MCYLPPSSSSRGDCAEQFLDCLGAQITLYRNFGTVCVCGDFNARCGNLQDISLLCDTEIPPHKVLDVEQNSHGKQFIVTTGELVTKAEQKWLACSNRITRPLLRAEYQQLRQKFDSLVRKTKRKWSNRTWEFLDSSLQGGPQTFWNQLRKHTGLGKKRSPKIPMEVIDGQRILTNKEDVLNKWYTDFPTLLNTIVRILSPLVKLSLYLIQTRLPLLI